MIARLASVYVVMTGTLCMIIWYLRAINVDAMNAIKGWEKVKIKPLIEIEVTI